MRPALGLTPSSPWSRVVNRPPTAAILGYLKNKWQEYETTFSCVGEHFSTRDEPTLTDGFAAFLVRELEESRQPFDGEFYSELRRVDLLPDGRRKIIGRTDIEWRLCGFPSFIVEFKVVGGGRPAKAYVVDGMIRFVDGRYGPKSVEGAMWALFRPSSPEKISHIEAFIDAHAHTLRCVLVNGANRFAPSTIAPGVASFDSLHTRENSAGDIRLAHIFINITP